MNERRRRSQPRRASAQTAKSSGRITIRAVKNAGDPAFRRAHRLLSRAFPTLEMLPISDWEDAMEERAERLWTDIDWHVLVAERGTSLVGAASGSYVGTVNVGIIGYIAVDPGARSRGIGLRLRRHLLRAFERDARRIARRQLRAVVGEVRSDNPWLRHLVTHEGAIALDFPYYQPALGVKRTPVPLVLYYQPLDGPKSSVSVSELRRLLYTMWRRPYRIARPLTRPMFRRMLKSLEGRRRVGQRELSQQRATGERQIA